MGDDNVMATIEFADGSRGGVLYTALAADSTPKEFLEVLGDGKAATLDNYRSLSLYHGTRKKVIRSRLDKGHQAEFSALIDSILQGKEAPIPMDELLISSLATLCIVESLSQGGPVPVDLARLTA